MEIDFNAYVRYGKLDSVDYEVNVEITEEEFARLVESAKTHFRFCDDPDVVDIYDKAYKAALELDVDVLKNLPEELATKMAYYKNISEEDAAKQTYTDEEIAEMLEMDGSRGVGYPSDLEDYF